MFLCVSVIVIEEVVCVCEWDVWRLCVKGSVYTSIAIFDELLLLLTATTHTMDLLPPVATSPPLPPVDLTVTFSEDFRAGYLGHAILNISWEKPTTGKMPSIYLFWKAWGGGGDGGGEGY